jgi:uncharacterized delta-60 repeat protein
LAIKALVKFNLNNYHCASIYKPLTRSIMYFLKSNRVLFLLLIIHLTSAQSIAQAGFLDPTFANNGILDIDLGSEEDYGYDIAVQPDGKIIVVGTTIFNWSYLPYVMRLNPDGTLDNTFSADGIAYVDISATDDEASSVVIQPDGKIVIGGNGNYHFALVRLNSDGSLDNTFGTNGIATTEFGTSSDNLYSIVLQPDGKIVASGTKYLNIDSRMFATARFNSDGTLDTSFSGDGKITTQIGTMLDFCLGNALQSDGKIVLVGTTETTTSSKIALVRYNPDGTLDTSFGANGIVRTAVGEDAIGIGLALQPDDKIVVTGYSKTTFASNSELVTLRYNTDGSLDNTFDTDGIVFTPFGTAGGAGVDVLVQTDGKIVAVGRTSYDADGDFAIVCYNSDGSLDNTFNDDGIANTAINNEMDGAVGVAQQPDGKIVVTGYTTNNGLIDVVVARFLTSMNTSISEINHSSHAIKISPNPMIDQTTIITDFNLINAVLTITDCNGQIVIRMDNINGQSVVFDRNGLTSGVYYINFSVANEVVATHKLVMID